MTIYNDKVRTAGFLVSPASGNRSFDTVTVVTTGALLAGSVLGKVTATGEFVQYDPSGADGSEIAVAILYAGVPASTTVKATVVARDAEVNAAMLVYPNGATQGEIDAAIESLEASHIIAR